MRLHTTTGRIKKKETAPPFETVSSISPALKRSDYFPQNILVLNDQLPIKLFISGYYYMNIIYAIGN